VYALRLSAGCTIIYEREERAAEKREVCSQKREVCSHQARLRCEFKYFANKNIDDIIILHFPGKMYTTRLATSADIKKIVEITNEAFMADAFFKVLTSTSIISNNKNLQKIKNRNLSII